MRAHGRSIKFWAYKWHTPFPLPTHALLSSAPFCLPLIICFVGLFLCKFYPIHPFSCRRSLGDANPNSSFVRWLTKIPLQNQSLVIRPSLNMDNNKKQVGGSSSSTMNFDHLFGPKDSSSTSASSTGLFGSIFPPPCTVGGRDSRTQDVRGKIFGAPGNNKGESSRRISNKNTSTNYQNETVEPSYFSSSIYYGGQENYSPRTRTTEPHHVFKKDKDDSDPNVNDSNSASRGNWWQGSLYY